MIEQDIDVISHMCVSSAISRYQQGSTVTPYDIANISTSLHYSAGISTPEEAQVVLESEEIVKQVGRQSSPFLSCVVLCLSTRLNSTSHTLKPSL